MSSADVFATPAGLLRRTRTRPPKLGALTWAAATVVFVAVLLAIVGPIVAPHDPNATNLNDSFVGPIAGHPLGFDGEGRDLLSKLLNGARLSLLGPTIVVVLAMLAGVAIGVIAAWTGGWLDAGISVVLDILFAFPAILLAILSAAVFGPSLLAATLALAIAYTPYIARLVRGAAARERTQEYIAASEALGFSSWAICLRHLVPNVGGLIVSQATLLFAYAMVDLAAISFLGLGVQPPDSDWGTMIASGKPGVLQGYPAETLSAGLCIIAVVVAVNLLGERLGQRQGNG